LCGSFLDTGRYLCVSALVVRPALNARDQSFQFGSSATNHTYESVGCHHNW
jgi:hypothetical protein